MIICGIRLNVNATRNTVITGFGKYHMNGMLNSGMPMSTKIFVSRVWSLYFRMPVRTKAAITAAPIVKPNAKGKDE